jgi:1,4-dihydroxy-6-naphthoate synthase
VRRPIPSLPPRKPGVITVAFSPDADDAFMLYGLVNGKVDTETRKYEWIRADIAALNSEANKGTYDVTAFSFGAWPEVSDRYLVLPCGGSFGDQVGPVVVAKTPVRSGEVSGLIVAVPGRTTTAALVLRLWLHPNRITLVEVPFQQVGVALKAGKARAGVLIHEGQLTYKADGLVRVMDLGQWWGEKTEGLPLPLGGMAIRRDIPTEERAKVALDLKRSIAYALGHREEALDYAMPFGRGLSRALLDKYVSMYVNELTLDYGERGRQAVHTLYDEAVRHGLLAERVDLDFA